MKRLLTALVALLLAPACMAVGPYLSGSGLPAGDLPGLMGRVEQRLRDDGFTVVGRHLPPGLPQYGSVIVTDAALNQAARKAGGTAVLATAIRVGVKTDGSVSYMNPDYWGRAYLRDAFAAAAPALRSVRGRLAHALGEGATFGGDVPETDLPGYRYMIGMERIDSLRNELNAFASFDDALQSVRANLAKGVGGTAAVYEVVLPEAKLAVIGVAMNDAETGEGWWVGKIGPDHVAALPYEIYLIDGKAYALYGRYRIALSWPALGMGQFMRIARAPDLIHETLARVAGAAAR